MLTHYIVLFSKAQRIFLCFSVYLCYNMIVNNRLQTGGIRLEQHISEAINRIRYMEELFDALQTEFSPDALRVLLQYYEGGQWLEDYR